MPSVKSADLRTHRSPRRRAPSERRPSDREEELRAMMTMAGHDLRSPLAAVTAHLEMLREEHADRLGEQGRRDLDAMSRAAARINHLVEELVEFAQADQLSLDLRPVPLTDLVAEVLADHDTAAGDRPLIAVSGELPVVVADGRLLRHVMDNLVGNAVKYAPPGDRARIEITARTGAGGTVRVEVADRGIGIPEIDRPRVFDAFHRSANGAGRPGTGLGLAICRRIVERHGGRIGVEPNPGRGSRFWFTVPAR